MATILFTCSSQLKQADITYAQVEPMLNGLERGYAVVSINYRLTSESIWPAQIHDCKAAVRWIKDNAEKYNFDPDIQKE